MKRKIQFFAFLHYIVYLAITTNLYLVNSAKFPVQNLIDWPECTENCAVSLAWSAYPITLNHVFIHEVIFKFLPYCTVRNVRNLLLPVPHLLQRILRAWFGNPYPPPPPPPTHDGFSKFLKIVSYSENWYRFSHFHFPNCIIITLDS